MASRLPRVIVVDDDPDLRGLIQRFLTEHGFSVRAVCDGAALDVALAREPADAVVLDLMMPDEDGLSICRRLRARGDDVPILMLTARGEAVDRIVGLEMGADDYLGKPFLPRELVARLHAVLRRTSVRYSQGRVQRFAFGPFLLDLADKTLHRDGQPVALSSREITLLGVLATSSGRALSRAQLIERSLGRDAEITDRAIDVQIVRLRRALGEDPTEPEWIRTVWGAGYMLVDAHPC